MLGDKTHREVVDISIWRIKRRDDELAVIAKESDTWVPSYTSQQRESNALDSGRRAAQEHHDEPQSLLILLDEACSCHGLDEEDADDGDLALLDVELLYRVAGLAWADLIAIRRHCPRGR